MSFNTPRTISAVLTSIHNWGAMISAWRYTMLRYIGFASIAALLALLNPWSLKAQVSAPQPAPRPSTAVVQESAQGKPLSLSGYTLGESIEVHNHATIMDCLVYPKRLTQSYYSMCDGLDAALEQGKRWTSSDGATYEHGKLVSFEMWANEPNDIVLHRLVSQFGSPTKQINVPNYGFATRWQDRVSEWDLSTGQVMLFEDNEPAGDGQPTVLIQTNGRAF
jgi:hypothetical protein